MIIGVMFPITAIFDQCHQCLLATLVLHIMAILTVTGIIIFITAICDRGTVNTIIRNITLKNCHYRKNQCRKCAYRNLQLFENVFPIIVIFDYCTGHRKMFPIRLSL